MKKKKTVKIPASFRRGLKGKKIDSIRSMLTDSSESELFSQSFLQGDDGKFHFTEPADAKSAKKLAGILKKLHKARSGPRIIRLVVVAVLITAPVIFNLFFLDRMVSGFLEGKLEDMSGTDVTVSGLDIQPLHGRVILRKLSFASESDFMVDAWVFKHLNADIDWSGLFHRRVLINELSGEILRDVPRNSEAVYPRKDPEAETDSVKTESDGFSIELPDFSSLSEELIPDKTLRLLESLKTEAEEDQKDWTDRIERDSEDIKKLAEEISRFIEEPLPEKTDIQAWTSRIEEGRRLSEEAASEKTLLDEYRTELDKGITDTRNALNRGRAAVDADLNRVKSYTDISSGTLNQLAENIIIAAAGPKAGVYYRKISALIIKLRASAAEKSGKAESGEKRINLGRTVSFPVVLPPRFSIRNLEFSGEEFRITGCNVGIDHDLAGSPSELSLEYGSRITAEATIDGRANAVNILEGNARVNAVEWPGGILKSDFGFSVGNITADGIEGITVPGHAVLSGWSAGGLPGGESGALSFISSSSPPLAFSYLFIYMNGETDLNISIDSESLDSWKKMAGDYLLAAGKKEAGRILPPEAADKLDDLEAVLGDWDKNENLLEEISGELISGQSDLDEMINELTAGASESLPLPKASDILKKAGSLFGN